MTDTIEQITLSADQQVIGNQLLNAIATGKPFHVFGLTVLLPDDNNQAEILADDINTDMAVLTQSVAEHDTHVTYICNTEDSDYGSAIGDMLITVNERQIAGLKTSLKMALSLVGLSNLDGLAKFDKTMTDNLFTVSDIEMGLAKADFDVAEKDDESETVIDFRWNPDVKLLIATAYRPNGNSVASIDFYVTSKHSSEKFFVSIEVPLKSLIPAVFN